MNLDRIAIEEAAANPARKAAAIHTQLALDSGPVPVFDIARALDVSDIRIAPLKGLEGALITTPERSTGAVLLNESSSPQRRNFSLAHELGHFLNPWHTPVGDGGFECSRKDMTAEFTDGTISRHLRQEAEANRFAIELLAPPRLMKPFLRGEADIAQILAAAEHLDISKAAGARRFVELHDAMLAVIFSRAGKMIGYRRNTGFPVLVPRVGGRMPVGPMPARGQISDWDDVDPETWISGRPGRELYSQTLAQADGHAMTLLILEGGDED